VRLSPSSLTTIVLISTLLAHRTTTLPLIISRFVNETFPGWSRTMEACIDMLADHGGAMFALVLYWGIELSSATPLCDEKCHFCDTTPVQASHGYVGRGWRTWRRLGGSLSRGRSWACVWGREAALGEKNSTSVCSLQ
jgi:hypothetical protein